MAKKCCNCDAQAVKKGSYYCKLCHVVFLDCLFWIEYAQKTGEQIPKEKMKIIRKMGLSGVPASQKGYPEEQSIQVNVFPDGQDDVIWAPFVILLGEQTVHPPKLQWEKEIDDVGDEKR